MNYLLIAIISVFAVVVFATRLGAELETGDKMIPDTKSKLLAQAIAHAEGFGVAGAIPTRAHNPGDLKLDKSHSPLGYLNGHTIFASDEEGWAALYRQIELIRSERSRVYNLSMTFEQMAQHYAEDWRPWLANVTAYLHVVPSTTLREYFK